MGAPTRLIHGFYPLSDLSFFHPQQILLLKAILLQSPSLELVWLALHFAEVVNQELNQAFEHCRMRLNTLQEQQKQRAIEFF